MGLRDGQKPSGLVSFFRYNVAAILATIADFGVLLLLKEIAGVHYVVSTSLAATLGAIIAFTLGRYWAFVSTEERKSTQALKYALVAFGSIALNTLGVFFFTNYLALDYKISKVITAVIVAIAYNYPMSRYYTFK